MKYFLWLGMLVWPSWASFGSRSSTFGTGLAVFTGLLVVGVLIGRKFPHEVGAIVLCGLLGGAVGTLVGLVVGVVASYWGGLFVALGFVGSCLIVAVLIKKYFSPIGVVVRI